jgi:hypothetical protein
MSTNYRNHDTTDSIPDSRDHYIQQSINQPDISTLYDLDRAKYFSRANPDRLWDPKKSMSSVAAAALSICV